MPTATTRDPRAELEAIKGWNAASVAITQTTAAQLETVYEAFAEQAAEMKHLAAKVAQTEDLVQKLIAVALDSDDFSADRINSFARVIMNVEEKVGANSTKVQQLAADVAAREYAAATAAEKTLADWMTGPWLPTRTYERGQIIVFHGASYMALKQSKNVPPSPANTHGSAAFWMRLSAAGAAGPRGEDLTPAAGITLPDAAPIVWPLSSPIARVTPSVNRTLTWAGMSFGGTYILHVIQPAVGGKTITWPATVAWPGGIAPTLSTTAAYRDILTFTSNGTYMFGSYAQTYAV